MYRDRRSLHKRISQSKRVNELPNDGALLYTWMIPHYDDFGRMNGSPEDIKYDIVPRRDIDIEEITRLLFAMEDSGLIDWYVIDGQLYLQMAPEAWEDHQTFKSIKRSSKIPPYEPDIHCKYRDQHYLNSTSPISTQEGGPINPHGSTDPPNGVDLSTQEGGPIHPHGSTDPPHPSYKTSKEKRREEKRRCLSKDKPPGADSQTKHFSTQLEEKDCEKIVSLCWEIQEKGNGKKPFNVFAFVQQKINEGGAHPQAMIETLQGTLDYWDTIKKSPWAYAKQIFNARNPQYSEDANIQETQDLKYSWHQFIKSPDGEKVATLINQFARSP